MSTFFLASQNMPFTIALSIMLLIAVLEGVGILIGLGISTLLESALPDMDLNTDTPDIESSSTLSYFFSWLRIGEVPFLIILIVFLTSFGISGLLIQRMLTEFAIGLLPGWLISIPAVLLALPSVRTFSGFFAKFIPQDETEAVSEVTFIGRIAVITLGQASINSPAEAKLSDEYQQSHYIMVEPDNIDESFSQGDIVLIVKKAGNHYKVIKNTHSSLMNN